MKTRIIAAVLLAVMVAVSGGVMAAEEQLTFKREANGDIVVYAMAQKEVIKGAPKEIPPEEAYALRHGLKGDFKIEGKPSEELVLSWLAKSEVTPNWTIYKYANGSWKSEKQTGEKVVSTNWLFAILFQYGIPLFVFFAYFIYGLTNWQMAGLWAVIAGGAAICSLVSLAGNETVGILFGIAAVLAVLIIIKNAGALASFVIGFIGWGSSIFLHSLVQKEIFIAASYLAAVCPLTSVLAVGAKWWWKKYREE